MSKSWLQISLRTLLVLILGFGIGLAVNYRFGAPATRGLDPNNIRQGDRLALKFNPAQFSDSRRYIVEVLADGSIRLPELGQVPAAGLSLDALTRDLSEKYSAYYSAIFNTPKVIDLFISFENTSIEETRRPD